MCVCNVIACMYLGRTAAEIVRICQNAELHYFFCRYELCIVLSGHGSFKNMLQVQGQQTKKSNGMNGHESLNDLLVVSLDFCWAMKMRAQQVRDSDSYDNAMRK